MKLERYISFDFGYVYEQNSRHLLQNYPIKLAYLSIFYIEKGSAKIQLDFKEEHLKKNDFVVLSEDNILLFKNFSEDIQIHCFFIEKHLASSIAYVLSNDLFTHLHYSPIVRLNFGNASFFNHWLDSVISIMKESSIYTERILCNHFQNIFLLLSEKINLNTLAGNKLYSRQEQLCWDFWDLIGKNAKSRRDVSFYADTLHITPYYLAQICHKFLNYSPKELINRQVILEIKNLLIYTDTTINEIAIKLHFSDPSYMGRFFKRETKMNPLEFRKNEKR
ncbi:AraC family transcriptional regulator [Empedobacter brevis]|uniref:AraC family transcriptional regulator n=1 Tax=Empedobacter brevis TaxID=247 RepID=A0AAJ1QDQ9_9FLAO|nr:helix-turn-helix domain-containing protein [Empedobacter brevis]MDM1072114.1 AraC family transcriptional regulator [Empedobacter brevis]QES91345.1 AraC family transcriptional regulator [Empedobacter brevis]QHC86380.1 hypothetical protein AS589_17120 [Empedobacter brevis]